MMINSYSELDLSTVEFINIINVQCICKQK